MTCSSSAIFAGTDRLSPAPSFPPTVFRHRIYRSRQSAPGSSAQPRRGPQSCCIQTGTSRQIIVARLDNEVTVKRYKQDGSVVWLMPENADFEPIKVNIKEDPLIIEGVVVGVLRRGRALS